MDSYWMWSGVSRPISYTNWAVNEPTETNIYAQACVYINDGYMYDMPCKNIFNYFICEENCRPQSLEIKVDTKDLVNLGGRNYYFSAFWVSLW
jgi:hypothetical protein